MQNLRPLRPHWRRLAAVVALVSVPGCSVNDFGLVSRDRMEVPGGIVHSLRAYGLHLDTRDDAPSLSLGLYQAQHVLALPCAGLPPNAFDSDRDLFAVARPQLSFSRVFGMQFKAGRAEVSMTLGARERLLALNTDASESVFRSIHFDPQHLHDTVLTTQSHSGCEITGAVE